MLCAPPRRSLPVGAIVGPGLWAQGNDGRWPSFYLGGEDVKVSAVGQQHAAQSSRGAKRLAVFGRAEQPDQPAALRPGLRREHDGPPIETLACRSELG
jgi:hypothetical protein